MSCNSRLFRHNSIILKKSIATSKISWPKTIARTYDKAYLSPFCQKWDFFCLLLYTWKALLRWGIQKIWEDKTSFALVNIVVSESDEHKSELDNPEARFKIVQRQHQHHWINIICINSKYASPIGFNILSLPQPLAIISKGSVNLIFVKEILRSISEFWKNEILSIFFSAIGGKVFGIYIPIKGFYCTYNVT